ncbi:MAG: SSU ribosomal protein S7p (S5e), partial [uncultured Solirubrobacteraceae bacterium]
APPRRSNDPAGRAGRRPPVQARHADHQQGDARRQEVHGREDRLRRPRDHRRAHGQGSPRAARGLRQDPHPGPRGPLPPRRRRDLPGPRRGPGAPRPDARDPLARRVRAQPPREDDGPAPRQRAPRRAVPAGRRVQAQGRHLPHGPGQQGLRALPLV